MATRFGVGDLLVNYRYQVLKKDPGGQRSHRASAS